MKKSSAGRIGVEGTKATSTLRSICRVSPLVFSLAALVSNVGRAEGQENLEVEVGTAASNHYVHQFPATSRVVVDGGYTGELFRNAHGGITVGTAHLHKLSAAITLSMELPGIGELQGYGSLLGTFGGSVAELSGDAQGASNIEAPEALRLYEAWVQKSWRAGSLLLGLYDLNRDFYVGEAAGLFINSSHGIGPEIAGSGRNGPSIFPATSLAARAEIAFSPHTYGRLAILDGVPGDPSDEGRFVHIRIDEVDGALLVAETGIDALGSDMRPFKIAAGAWRYTRTAENPPGPEEIHQGTHGGYLIAEARMTSVGNEGGLSAFARAGYADDTVNATTIGWGAGVVYDGPFRRLPDDRAGIGFAALIPDMDFSSSAGSPEAALPSEIAIEVTYQHSIHPSLHIQPDLQYILYPGMHSTFSNALLLGLRIDVTF